MQPPQYSPDGRWWWDGTTWRPVPPTPPTPPRVTEPPGMFWFLRSPGWFSPFFVTGCITLLPFVGQIVLNGWYLAARDNLRAGWLLLPRAGFQYLERGLAPWVVTLVYGLYSLPVFFLLSLGLAAAIGQESGVAVALLASVLVLFTLAYLLTLGFVSGALFDLADAQGILAAIDPRRLWAAATADTRQSWRVFGALFLGAVIYLAITIVALPILIFIPFGGLALNLLLPGVYLMAAPAQADFNRVTDPRSAQP